MSADLIQAYLAELRAKLRAKDAELIIAEAEDHLRESVAGGLAIGMTETEAQEAAISAFGSVRAVVRAHRAKRVPLVADLVLAAWKLGWTGMFAIAGSGFLALGMDHLLGRGFVGQAPAGAVYPASRCLYWLSMWPGARTCAQAAMLEQSSDAVSLRVIGGGIGGLVLLAGYLVARALWRRRAVAVLPGGFFAGAAVAIFGLGALGLAVITVTGTPFGLPAGPGSYLSGALAAAAVAAAYLPAAWRALRATR